MDRRIALSLMIAVLAGPGCTADLAWDGDKQYSPPPATRLNVEKLGIDDFVDILPAGGSTTVQRMVTNTGSRAVPAGYQVNETVIRWVFLASTGSAGWVAGDPATHTVFSADSAGPGLGPGQSAAIGFGPIGPLPCGLYQETLTIDTGNAVAESNEANNQSTHFFFVPSSQQLNITVNTINDTLFHADGPSPTHDFVVNSAGAPAWVYGHFSFVTTEGSRAATVPVPPVAGGPGPQVIQMIVTPLEHSIPSLGFQPTVTGKITVISEDGCVVRQETARAFIEHEN